VQVLRAIEIDPYRLARDLALAGYVHRTSADLQPLIRRIEQLAEQAGVDAAT
jgi:hypothetical protein